MRQNECTRYYDVIRITNDGSEDFIMNAEVIETAEMTWTEFMKYAKKAYDIISTAKRRGCVYVR